jgi:hypothetical protein
LWRAATAAAVRLVLVVVVGLRKDYAVLEAAMAKGFAVLLGTWEGVTPHIVMAHAWEQMGS